MRKKLQKFVTMAAAFLLAFTPSIAGAKSPSDYVNGITEGFFGEILNIAPGVALVIIAWCILMYFISGEDHDKSKHRKRAFIAIGCYGALLVIDQLLTWFQNLV